MVKNDILSILIHEGESYRNISDIEKLIDSESGMANIPMQPLYSCLKSLNSGQISKILPRLSKDQRKVILDLDLWLKDGIDPLEFQGWIECYAMCPEDKIREEFLQSNQFLLYLKSAFNIYTFDVEDPQYPDHDNYFLTEDSLLLFEHHEEYPFVDQVKSFIRELYSLMGVEKAYALLFKVLQDSYLPFLEEEYQAKKSNLEEYGFVDYFEALNSESIFPSLGHLNNFIKNKNVITPDISNDSRSQSLQYTNAVLFKPIQEQMTSELQQITDDKRNNFLHFNFIRWVNSVLTMSNSIKKGAVAQAGDLKRSRSKLLLGFDYLLNFENVGESQTIFSKFDFFDIYKIGNSLIKFIQKSLKRSLQNHSFLNEDITFIGRNLSDFHQYSFEDPVKYRDSFEGQRFEEVVDNYRLYQAWTTKSLFFLDFLPVIETWRAEFLKLKESGTINSEYYLNYDLSDIDLEVLLINEYFHFKLDTRADNHYFRFGLKVEEYKNIMSSLLDQDNKLIKNKHLAQEIQAFTSSLGIKETLNFEYYFIDILKEHIEGYDFLNMAQEDFRHVGGPILLVN